MTHQVEISDSITVSELSTRLNVPVTRLITELMKNGLLVTLNERIDVDTAQILVNELGLEIEIVGKSQDDQETAARTHTKPKSGSSAEPRPPVVAVMGHVDHGKTSLLDRISNNSVAKGEAGGITQHISAFQISHKDRLITFLDTPGHEAFASIREHGAMLTDIVLLVIAADDGIKPQTIEAIRFARKAGVKIIIAINKVDKEAADVNRIKQQLAENELMPEEWGGETIIQEVSAKTGQGIEELLDMLLLVSDVEELKADLDKPAQGVIIEAHLEVGRGPVAHALIEQGVLVSGSFIVAGQTYAKIRNLEDTNTRPKTLLKAGPSTPVTITGFKILPEFGDEFQVVENEKIAKQLALDFKLKSKVTSNRGISSNEMLRIINRSNKLSELNIILKADVQGSLTSVMDSFKALETEEVAVRIVSSGVGALNSNDLRLAATTKSIIYGFNVTLPSSIRQQAMRDKIEVKIYNVIYELIEDIRNNLEKLLEPEEVETILGSLVVKGIFSTTKSSLILGGEVASGKLAQPSFARIYRDKKLIANNLPVVNLKKGPMNVNEVIQGELCGLNLKTLTKVQVLIDDRVELYNTEIIDRHL